MKKDDLSTGLSLSAIALACALAAYAVASWLPFLSLSEKWLDDLRFSAFAKSEAPSAQVVLVTINEDTLATLAYRSPIDRGFIADLLEHLDSASPKSIGLDILFDQPTEPHKDQTLKTTLASMATPVVVAVADMASGLTEQQSNYLNVFTKGLTTGSANLARDSVDGTVRWIHVGKTGDGFVPKLVAIMGESPPHGTDLPLVYRAPLQGGQPGFSKYPAHMIKVLPKSWFTGKAVLIGADLPLIDRHRTPFAALFGAKGYMPGVEIHAHALSQVLENRTRNELTSIQLSGLFLLLSAIGIVAALIDMTMIGRFLTAFFVTAAYGVVAFAIFAFTGGALPVLAPVMAFLFSFSGATMFLGRQARRQKRIIRETFSHYVSPVVVETLLANPENLNTGGERREVTYLFTDLAGFTTLTESMDPKILVGMLNEYLDGMIRILMKHGATLDKLIGDAVVAFFNAPLDQPDHAMRAVKCALALDAFAQRFAAEQHAMGRAFGHTRIGVHSGKATIGNFGGEAFFDYTGHGDTVNTAARLESVNKHLGTRICISADTYRGCEGIAFRPIGVLVLKGKTEGVMTYEPIPEDDANAALVQEYGKAYTLMERQENTEAEAAFRTLVAQYPDDPLIRLHMRRFESGEEGVRIVMKEK